MSFRETLDESDDLALRVSDLRKVYRRKSTEIACTFDVPAGSITALVGANGAGKTTLMHMITGLITPTSGEFSVLGHRIVPGRPTPAVGFVAQGAPMYSTMRVREVADVARRLNPVWDAPTLAAVLDRAEISGRSRVGTLSTGERAQFALGLALAKRPALLVLDEPFANLDPVAVRAVMSLISTEVAESGTTVLLSTHAIAEVRRLYDRVVVMKRGTVVVSDAVDDLLDRHLRVVVPAHAVDLFLRADPHVVGRSDSARESSFLVRDFEGGDIAVAGQREHSVDLAELVLAYLN